MDKTKEIDDQLYELIGGLCSLQNNYDSMTPHDRLREANKMKTEFDILCDMLKEEPKSQTKLPEGDA